MSRPIFYVAAVFAAFAALIMVRPTDVQAQDYLLQPGDVVEVTVLEDPNLNRRVLVGPDGNVAFPLAGTLKAGGVSLTDLQTAIRDRLRKQFVTAPSVTASLVSLGEDSDTGPDGVSDDEMSVVYVIGEVQRPGRYEYKTEDPVNALQALAMAGGPSPFAARKRIQIRENAEEGERMRTLDYDAIEDGAGVGDAVMELANGAIIVVPERGLFE